MKEKLLHIEIVSPSKPIFNGEVKSITLPGTEGNFQVLYNHAPILSSLTIGIIKIEDVNGNKRNISTSGGSVEVKNNSVVVLANSAEFEDEIDTNRAQKAKERAEKRLNNKSSVDIDVTRAELALARALNRLKISK